MFEVVILFLALCFDSLSMFASAKPAKLESESQMVVKDFMMHIKLSDFRSIEENKAKLMQLSSSELTTLSKEAECRLNSCNVMREAVSDIVTYKVFRDTLSDANVYFENKIKELKIPKVEADDMHVLSFTREYFHRLEAELNANPPCSEHEVDEYYGVGVDRVQQAKLNSIRLIKKIGYSVDQCSIVAGLMKNLSEYPESLPFKYLQQFIDKRAEDAARVRAIFIS